MSEPTSSASDIQRGLAFIDSLSREYRDAFLGLFAGAMRTWMCFNGDTPHMGKSECERVGDWRSFYGHALPAAGLLTFTEGDPEPALGMAPGSTCTKIEAFPTNLGWDVREAWWERWSKRCDERAKEFGIA